MELSEAEYRLFLNLPKLPSVGLIRKPQVVWIVEWLPPDEQPTGKHLHEWISKHSNLESKYFSCKTKNEMIKTIQRVAFFESEKSSFQVPILHIEAHGNEDFLEGPNRKGLREQLYWSELNGPLQDLNRITRCNLIVFIAACTGFAGIKVFFQGPLAPAVALVGPVAPISPSDLLNATKEFYRGLNDDNPSLDTIVKSATREAGTVLIELEAFVLLAYETFTESLIVSKRHVNRRWEVERLRQRMRTETPFSQHEIARRLEEEFPLEKQKLHSQAIWNTMFMIGIFPENEERFQVNWSEIHDAVESSTLT